MESDTLHYKAKEACTHLLTVCKTMAQAVENKCAEEKLVELVRSVAVSALNVSSSVTAHVESRDQELREKAELQENFLSEYDKGLRETIVTLVRHTRDFYANSLDFMTKQALNNSLKEVAQRVKSLIEASRGTKGPIFARGSVLQRRWPTRHARRGLFFFFGPAVRYASDLRHNCLLALPGPCFSLFLPSIPPFTTILPIRFCCKTPPRGENSRSVIFRH
jgi:hypothetical protein